MTHLRQVVSPNDHHEQRVRGGDAFRARLEQHRRFRVEQLKGLEGDRLARSDEVIAVERLTALPMARLCIDCQYAKEMRGPLPADIVDVWGYGSFPASDPPANW